MEKNIITYSKAMNLVLTRLCVQNCSYCAFKNNEENLFVPYSMIKPAKLARKEHTKEAYIVAGERPDRSNSIRSKLAVWGFESYVHYVYTVCELAFLEGLLPHLNIGYLTEEEVKVLRRIATSVTIMLECGDQKFLDTVAHPQAETKTLERQIEAIRLTTSLKWPTTTGIIVGMGESMKSRQKAFEMIRDVHKEFDGIQSVMLQNFVPHPNTPMQHQKSPTKADMLETVKLARKILPEDVVISVPLNLNPDIMPLIKAGVGDLGHVATDYDLLAPDQGWSSLKELEKLLKKNGYGLQRRLPIFSRYVRDNWYSRKLAQMLDKYQLMLKQAEEKEKLLAEKLALKNALKPKTSPKKVAVKSSSKK